MMKKDTITQFVSFITQLGPYEFIPAWEHYAKKWMDKKNMPVLQQLTISTGKTRYLSRHTSPEHDFRFNFMKERHSEHFAEHNVRVMQLGGYLRLPLIKKQRSIENGVRFVVLASHDETNISFYEALPLYHNLTIYQAFYESCMYGHIMEFSVPAANAEELEQLLKKRQGIEAGICKECLAPQL
ncbi:MAG: hypothetical protein JNK14_14970 [Chitinophagaceae bacterium]|nr:hypothetical protein [Chitinophagaceae bacterium]